MPAPLRLLPTSLIDKGPQVCTQAPSQQAIEEQIRVQVQQAIEAAKTSPRVTFMAFEKSLWATMMQLGRLLLVLFLAVREEHERATTPQRVIKGERVFERRPAQARSLSTLFGVIQYFRTYLRGSHGHGYHPLDVALGLTADRLSLNILSLAARLSTMLSFARAQTTLVWFLGAAPSTEVIEQTVLGLGRRTAQWFESAPAPQGDGEVLVMQFDGKGAPTATDSELERRRGKRRKNRFAHSPRHRGRERRGRWGRKPRRKKGDKSKNARMATLVTMYTLRRDPQGSGWLFGPINRRHYASFAPKRHAFAIARREADKRGFGKDSGKLLQIVTDGDEDLARYVKEFFPEAIHTVDIMHVIEYLHQAAECLYCEGSEELKDWVAEQKERLYRGQEAQVVAEMKRQLESLPLRGPGSKGKRERLEQAIGYLAKRLDQMKYKERMDQDLEIGSGSVEGAVKNIIGARFDFGGMRWIRERAEALLQLRCIEANGDWEAFIQWSHDGYQRQASASGERIRIQQNKPAPLPTIGVAA